MTVAGIEARIKEATTIRSPREQPRAMAVPVLPADASAAYPERWTIGSAISASGPRRPAARPAFSMGRHHRIRRYRRFVEALKGGPLGHRCSDRWTRHRRSGGDRGSATSENQSYAYTKSALQLEALWYSSLPCRSPVPWWGAVGRSGRALHGPLSGRLTPRSVIPRTITNRRL